MPDTKYSPSGWEAVGYGIGGGFERDRKIAEEERLLKRQDLQLRAEKEGYQLTQEGIAPSESNVQNTVLVEMNRQLKELQQYKAKQIALESFRADLEAGTPDNMNNMLNSPEYQSMFNSMGYSGVRMLNRDNPADIAKVETTFKNLGYKPDEVKTILYGTDSFKGLVNDENAWKGLASSYPVLRKTNGQENIVSMGEIYTGLGLHKMIGSEKAFKDVQDRAASVAQSISGKFQFMIDAERSKAESTQSKSGLETKLFNKISAQVDSGELSAEEAFRILQGKSKDEEQKGFTPFSIQEAEYFGAIKAKMERGTATPEEKATYNAFLVKQGGTTEAKLESLGIEETKLKEKGIDLNNPSFNLDSLDPDKKTEAQKVIRKLETTEGGKKLVSNISGILEKDLGSVQATALKMADLVTKKDVSTSVVTELINKSKSYMPSSFMTMDEKDLQDAEFRQAFLSSSALFLKLQSGLTVSDREANRFAQSFGTLSKNEKVNMVGLKTKLDEIIGSYENNAVLEPTLYNAKYRSGISTLKRISSELNTYVAKPVSKSKNLSSKDIQELDAIFGGK